MVGCGLACPGCGGAGEFRGSGWGWDCGRQDPGARVSGLGGIPSWGGGSNTEHGTIYIYIHTYV